MGLSTGSRITIDGVNGTAIVTDWDGNPVMVKYDRSDKIFNVDGHTIEPIITK